MAKRVQVDRTSPTRQLRPTASPVSTYVVPEYVDPRVGKEAEALSKLFGGAAEAATELRNKEWEQESSRDAVKSRADFALFKNDISAEALRLKPNEVEPFVREKFNERFQGAIDNPESPWYMQHLTSELDDFMPKAINKAAENDLNLRIEQESDNFSITVQDVINEVVEAGGDQNAVNSAIEAVIKAQYADGKGLLDRTALNTIVAQVGADEANQGNDYVLNWMRSNKLDKTNNAAYERPLNTMLSNEAGRDNGQWLFDTSRKLRDLAAKGEEKTLRAIAPEIIKQGQAMGINDFQWLNGLIDKAISQKAKIMEADLYNTALDKAVAQVLVDGVFPADSFTVPGTDKLLTVGDIKKRVHGIYMDSFRILAEDDTFLTAPENADALADAEEIAKVVVPRIKVPAFEDKFTSALRDLSRYNEGDKLDQEGFTRQQREFAQLSQIANHIQQYGGEEGLQLQLGERNYKIWKSIQNAQLASLPASTIAKSLANPQVFNIDKEILDSMMADTTDPDRNDVMFGLWTWDANAAEGDPYRRNWLKEQYKLALGAAGGVDSEALRQGVMQDFINNHAYITFENGVTATIPINNVELMNAFADKKIGKDGKPYLAAVPVDVMQERMQKTMDFFVADYRERVSNNEILDFNPDAVFHFSPHPYKKNMYQVTDQNGNTVQNIKYSQMRSWWWESEARAIEDSKRENKYGTQDNLLPDGA